MDGLGGRRDFDEFFESTFENVRRTLVVVLGDREAARDVAQDAYVKAFVHWRRVSGYHQPLAWVRKVAVRLAVRQRQRDLRFTEESVASVPFESSAVVDRRLDLLRALEQLSPMQRAAIALHYLDDLAIGEVALVLGCAESTARVHLHRGRVHLGTLLGEELDDVR